MTQTLEKYILHISVCLQEFEDRVQAVRELLVQQEEQTQGELFDSFRQTERVLNSSQHDREAVDHRDTEKRAVETKHKFSASSTVPIQSEMCSSSSVKRTCSRLGYSPSRRGDGRYSVGPTVSRTSDGTCYAEHFFWR